jgi:mannose/fructose/N-acetylgalactosamine-specific phosphotransferase system component IID
MVSRLRKGDLIRMALRTSLLQATWNYERQQGTGWAWALEPALERLIPDPAERRRRLAEHTAYFNTQPTLASLALGAVAGLEEQRAEGAGPDADAMAGVKSVLGSSLAALGDRLFWLTLRPFAACVGILSALTAGPVLGALTLWLCYNGVHQSVRVLGVGWGYRGGPTVLRTLRPRLEALTHALTLAGAALVGVLVAALLVPGGVPRPLVYQALLALGLGFGLIAARRARPSPTGWALCIGAAALAAVWIK